MVEFGLDAIYGLATGQGVSGWLNLGINLIISTIVGGIVILILFEIISKAWGGSFKATNAFLLVLVINIVNLLGIMAFVAPYIPYAGLILPILVWIILIKVFFGEMSWMHTIITGIVGYAISIILIPNLVAMVSGYLPF